VREVVVISGKGGTGKTSLVAAFASLADGVALADCDVDAADLHLILEPTIVERREFSGGSRARVVTDLCAACGKCREVCRFDAVFFDGPGNGGVEQTFRIDPIACEGCGVCAWFCPAEAIEFAPAVHGEWFVSETRCGPMVHAELGVGGENSGKLVSVVRERAREIAEAQGLGVVLIDGSPGTGCPVIASVTGAHYAVIVTEPTLSGLHDLERILELTRHFRVAAGVIVNKADLNEGVARGIAEASRRAGAQELGKIPYERAFTEAQIQGKTLLEYGDFEAGRLIASAWEGVCHAIAEG